MNVLSNNASTVGAYDLNILSSNDGVNLTLQKIKKNEFDIKKDSINYNLNGLSFDSHKLIDDILLSDSDKNFLDNFNFKDGVKFNILTKTGYNGEQVILQAVQRVKEFFELDKWQIGQPIVLSDLAYQISLVDGVSAVVPPDDVDDDVSAQDRPPVQIVNKYDSTAGYSGNLYDIRSATKEGVIYPSMDPSCFELKFPNKDIRGKVL